MRGPSGLPVCVVAGCGQEVTRDLWPARKGDPHICRECSVAAAKAIQAQRTASPSAKVETPAPTSATADFLADL